MNEVLQSISQVIQALSLVISVICLAVVVYVLKLLLPLIRELREQLSKLNEPIVQTITSTATRATPAPVPVPATFAERIEQATETLQHLEEEPVPPEMEPAVEVVPPVCATCKAKVKKITGSTILEGKTVLTFTCGRCGKTTDVPENLVPAGLLGAGR